jgi:leucyl aminopeptidase
MLNTSKAGPRAKTGAASPGSSRPIQVRLDTSPVDKAKAAVLVIGVFADGTLPASSSRIDSTSRGRLKAIVGLGDLGEAAGSTLLLHRLPGVAAERVLLVSLGQPSGYGDKAFSAAVSAAARVLAGAAASDAAVALADVELPGRSLAGRLELATRLLADGAYRFSRPWTADGGSDSPRRGARNIALLVSGKVTPELQAAVRRGRAIAEGMALAKDLGNLPGNICNPAYLADVARALGSEFDLDVEVLEREQMRSLGMGAALAVGQASEQPCKFIVMHDDRDPQYGRRGPPGPCRRADVRRALQAGVRDRHRHPDRSLRDCPRQHHERLVCQR